MFDFISKIERIPVPEVMRNLEEKLNLAKPLNEPKSDIKPKLVASYDYIDETGKQVYQALRLEPKSFRQRRMGEDGKWIWNMEGVRRILYNLPKVLKATRVIIVEGEKDADNLSRLGFIATCNVGGAGKWLEGYNNALKGKEVVICGDNDKAGEEHVNLVRESLAGKVKSVRQVKIPLPHKDVSDFLEANGEGGPDKLAALIEGATEIFGGIDLPIYSMAEMEARYKNHVVNIKKQTLSLGSWLPSLGRKTRGLVPGELCTILAETGIGKTAVLQNIAKHCRPLKVLLFEMELPDSLCFERFVQIESKKSGWEVEKTYYENRTLEWCGMDHVWVCPTSKHTPETLEDLIVKAELKIGERPPIIMVDYIGLVQGKGSSRYEKLSNVAEEMKALAKSTNTVVIMASQVHRKGEQQGCEIYLNDAKDSGSIENSTGLLLGIWKEDDVTMKVKIVKNTKGKGGDIVTCNFNGETLTITERHPGL